MSGVQNVLEVSDWLTMECARMLGNELFVAAGFNPDFAKEYNQEFAVGETIRVPYPWRPIGGEGIDYQPEPIDRRHFTVTVDKIPHVHFEWNSVEQALRLTRGREAVKEQILKPAMQKMRQKIELMAAQWAAIQSPNVTGVLGTDPTTLGFAATARTRMIQMSGWAAPNVGRNAGQQTLPRTAAISPSIMQSIVQQATVTTPVYNPGDEISTAFKEGYLGRNGGFEFQESMSLMTITAGTRASTCAISGSNQSGSSLLISCTSGDTFKAGEKFSIGTDSAGPWPVNPGTLQRANKVAFQASVAGNEGDVYTATGSTITLPITDSIEGPASGYQNITTLPQNGDAITWWPGTNSPNGLTGTLSTLFNRDAFSIVGVKLANPEQGGTVQMASQNRDPDTGISVAYIRVFDGVKRRWISRFDALLGFGNFYNRNCSIVVAGA